MNCIYVDLWISSLPDKDFGLVMIQDALRSSLEASIIPAFEVQCKAMFDQIDGTLQNGLIKHLTAAQQQCDSTHSPLAIALRVCISSHYVM